MTVTRTVNYANEQLDKCFLPFDGEGAENPNSILMPFRQEYPARIRNACPGVDDQIKAVLPQMCTELEEFLGRNTRLEQPGAPEVTYREAVAASLTAGAHRHYRAAVSAMFDNLTHAEGLDRLDFLLRAVSYFAGPKGNVRDEFVHLNSTELRDYVALLLRDQATMSRRSLESIRYSMRRARDGAGAFSGAPDGMLAAPGDFACGGAVAQPRQP
jgi:hypothetical protein